MNGNQNVINAIEFKGPEYLPVDLYFGKEWINEKDDYKVRKIEELVAMLRHDIITPSTFVHTLGDVKVIGNSKHWYDEWGTGWEDDGYGSKSVYFPLEGGYDLLKDYSFPDPELGPHILLEDVYKKHNGTQYLRACVWFTLFERLWMLRGFENMLVDPYMDEENFEQLRDRIVEFNLARIDKWLKLGVNGIYFSDDWGTQRGLLMRPEDWRKYYKPAYEKMFRRVREGGAHVWMHLCGNVFDIIPDLIDIGLNVLNPIQPQAMNVDRVAAEFGGKVCFNGGVDVQGTLVTGTPADVRKEVYHLVDVLGRYQGGYIGSTSHSIMPETPLDNIHAMFEAFVEIQSK